MNIFSVCWLFTLLIAHVGYLCRHKYQHFFPDWEMLRGLDALRFSLLATNSLSSDWPCTLLSTAVYYYYCIIFLCLMTCYLRTTRSHHLFSWCVSPVVQSMLFPLPLVFLLAFAPLVFSSLSVCRSCLNFSRETDFAVPFLH